MFEEALERYGYVVLFIGSGLEGDAVLGTAAFLAQQGKLEPVSTFLIAIAGSAVASELSFRVGRNQGAGWVARRAGQNPKFDRVRGWVASRTRLLVFVSRFLWGFRLTIPALCGASGMTQPAFTFWNLAGALVWAAAVGAGAYFLGNSIERLWEGYSDSLGWIAAGVFTLLFGVYLWRRRDRLAWDADRRRTEPLPASPLEHKQIYEIDCTPIGDIEPEWEPGDVFQRQYDFTEGKDWFSHNRPVWKSLMREWGGKEGLRYLEVGSSEGRSMVWMFENVLTDPSCTAVSIDPFYHWPGFIEKDGEVLDCFHANIRTAGVEERVRAIQGYSEVELRKLPVDELFDLIYIDGNHRATGVLEDLVLAWRLLRPGGLLIADDYKWKPDWELSERPKMAIDFFTHTFGEELEIVHRGYQVAMRKASAEALAALPKP